MYCPSCRRTVVGNSKFCDYCGKPLVKVDRRATTASVFIPNRENNANRNNARPFKKMDIIDSYELFAKASGGSARCAQCGAILPDGDIFCGRCGAKANSDNEDNMIFSDSENYNRYREADENTPEEHNEINNMQNIQPSTQVNRCPQCGCEVEADSHFCERCGYALETAEDEFVNETNGAFEPDNPETEQEPDDIGEPDIAQEETESDDEPEITPEAEPDTGAEEEIRTDPETKVYIIEKKEAEEDTNESAAAHCRECGAMLQADSVYCHICGRKLDDDEMQTYCCACGAKLIDGALFCHRCGEKL